MKTKPFRFVVLVFILGLVILLSASYGARDARLPKSAIRAGVASAPRTAVATQSQVSIETGSLWARSLGAFYGGPAYSSEEWDWASDILSIGKGRFVAAGAIRAFYNDSADLYQGGMVMGFDQDGIVKWRVQYPPDPKSQNIGSFVALARIKSEGCLAVGTILDGSTSQYRVLVMNIRRDGGVRWTRSYSLVSSSYADAWGGGVTATRDGGYIVAADVWTAETDSAVWVFKLDDSGKMIWSKIFKSNSMESVKAVRESPDGRLFVMGVNSDSIGASYCENCGYSEYIRTWIISLSNRGDFGWQKSYSLYPANTPDGYTYAQSMTTTTDGGLALTGYIRFINGGEERTWVCKLGSSGGIDWQRTYSGGYSSSIIQTSDGGYLVAKGYDYPQVLKLGANGGIQWVKEFGRPLRINSPRDAFEKEEGGYVILTDSDYVQIPSGFRYSPWTLISLDKNGFGGIGCPFSLAVSADAQAVGVQVVPDLFTAASLNYQMTTLAYTARAWPPFMVEASDCSH